MKSRSSMGRTNLDVSILGFGSAPIGNLYGSVSQDLAVETIRFALKQGMTFFGPGLEIHAV